MGLPGTIAGGAGVGLPSFSPPGAPSLGGLNNIVPYRPPLATPVNPLPTPPTPPTPTPTPPAATPTATPGRALSGAGIVGAVAGGIAAGALVGANGGGWAESIGAGLGTTGGSIAGQLIGGALGSLAGPGGTAAGVFAGGMIGGLIGGAVGQYAGQLLSDAISPTFITPDVANPPGSSAVNYLVIITGQGYSASTGLPTGDPGSTPVNLLGPLRFTSLPDVVSSAFYGITDTQRLEIRSIPTNNSVVVRGRIVQDGQTIGIQTYTVSRTDGQPEGNTPGTYAPNPARNPAGDASYNQANRPRLPATAPSPAGFVPPPVPLPVVPPAPAPTTPQPQPEPQPEEEPLRVPPGPQITPTTPTRPEINPGPRPGVTPGPATDPGRPLRPLAPPATPGSTPRTPQTPTIAPPFAPPNTPLSPPVSPPTTPLRPPGTPFTPPALPPVTPPEVPPGLRPPATTPNRLLNPPGENPTLEPTTTPTTRPTETPQNPRCCQPDLSEVINRLEQIKRRIGHNLYPVSVPDQIAKENPQQRTIENLTEMQVWQIEQLDGVLGKWPAGISIPGPNNTTVPLNLSNVSQAFTEQVGMLTSMAVTLAQTLHASTRSMIQAGSATQQAHLAHQIARANAEFLGYESQTVASQIPLTYTPGLNPLDGLLQESSQAIKGFANKDTTDLKHILIELQQAAAIIRAVYWRKLDPKEDFEDQIKKVVKDKSEFLDSEQYREKPASEDDWKEYLRQVEQGFLEYRNIKVNNGKPGEGEDNPYNRGPESAPKITDISDGDTDKKKQIEQKRSEEKRKKK